MHLHQFLVSRDFGGAGLMAVNLARWLIDRGLRTDVWVPGPGPAVEAVENAGLHSRLYDLDTVTAGRLRRVWAWLALGLRLRRGSLAHVHTPGVYRLLLPALRLARLRTVVHVQIDAGPEELRWAFRSPPDLIITCARYMVAPIRAALDDHHSRLRIVAVPNAVDTERFTPGDRAMAKARVQARQDRPLALMMANLAPHKGQETAIRAVAHLKSRGTDVDCWLAGTERGGQQQYQRHLQSLALELGVGDRVRLLGQRNDGPDLLRAADVFLLPSTKEGLPLSILEAQACKVPVMAAATAGVPEVVQDGETGFLIPADDATGYAERIQSLLIDASQRHAIVERAYAMVTSDYSCASFCARVHELYHDVFGTAHRHIPLPAGVNEGRQQTRHGHPIATSTAR
jgi:glycosyltransferase involved in cell wall biosynthesis